MLLIKINLYFEIISLENDEKAKSKNYLEFLKSERDYKRRRQNYRAKNVHTTKKSYTEVCYY